MANLNMGAYFDLKLNMAEPIIQVRKQTDVENEMWSNLKEKI